MQGREELEATKNEMQQFITDARDKDEFKSLVIIINARINLT